MNNQVYSVKGKIVDVVNNRIFEGSVEVSDGRISKISEHAVKEKQYILPGLIDAHVHIESSMLVPAEFARLAVMHGTVGSVSDPHEIANVLGLEGVEFMIKNGQKVPFYFHFGAPSCVPATPFETAGAAIDADNVEALLHKDDIGYLSEMMNFPGVLNEDPEVMKKIKAAQRFNKPVDGHAPGLKGEEAKKYASAGIQTDHECFTLEEALDKIDAGMKIAIREGSAAKNYDALYPLLEKHPASVMFCSDDKHPDDLINGHINQLIKRSIQNGIDPLIAIRAATLNPVKFYNLPTGLLQEGDPATFVTIDNMTDFNVLSTYIKGQCVAENGKTYLENQSEMPVNQFWCDKISVAAIELLYQKPRAQVINVVDGQIITGSSKELVSNNNNYVIGDTDKDILKIVVVNRYKKAKPAVALVKNTGFKNGAIASSVAHDSHNIIAVGSDDEFIVKAINLVIEEKGGISAVCGAEKDILPLPVAGLMTTDDGFKVAEKYQQLDKLAKKAGSQLYAPFMSLSFLALPVIPQLKITDKGLFDVDTFAFTPLFID